MSYSKEIPYSCEVAVTGFKDAERLLKMNATIFTTRESHLPILIGTKGKEKGAVGTRLASPRCALRIHLIPTPPLPKKKRQTGSKLKEVGTLARADLEAFFGKKVYLELRVKVRKDWRSNAKDLKAFGYIPGE